MNLATNVVVASLVFGVLMGLVVIVTWFIMSTFYRRINKSGRTPASDMIISYSLFQLLFEYLYGFYLVPATILSAIWSVVTQIRANLLLIVVIGLVTGGVLGALEYHDVVIHQVLIVRQCYIQPVFNQVILPLLNILRLIYNAIIPIFNFIGAITSFLFTGAPKLLFVCGVQNVSLANLLDYFFEVIRTFFADLKRWFDGDVLRDKLDLFNTFKAFGGFVAFLRSVANCFCAMFDFVWVYIITALNFQSLHHFLVNLINIPLRVVQIPLAALIRTPRRLDFDPLTLTVCGAVQDFGEIFEELIYLTAETLYALISRERDLPGTVSALLSVHYSNVLTHPVCALVRLANMTIAASINVQKITTREYYEYFQFGFVIDEFRVAADAVAAPFGALFNADAESLVVRLLYLVLDVIGFAIEWVGGNVVFLIYGEDPLPATFGRFNIRVKDRNILRYYFIDYWLKAVPLGEPVTIGSYTYSSSLDRLFRDLFVVSDNIGNLLGRINAPLGHVVNYFVNALVALVRFLANLISYIYPLFAPEFDLPMPTTPNYIDVDLFFNQSFFFAGACGDLLRQFQPSPPGCPPNSNDELFCAAGNTITEGLDILFYLVRTLLYFLLDVLTVRAGTLKFCIFGLFDASDKSQCVRMPDFTTAIDRFEGLLCSLAYTVSGLIPELGANTMCQFASTSTPGTSEKKQCGRVQNCLGLELCTIAKLFLVVPLQIANALFVKATSASSFDNFTTFFSFSFGLIVDQLAKCFEYLGLILDCMVCAFSPAGATNKSSCASPIYNLFKQIGDALRALADALTGLFLNFVKLVLLLIVGLFTSGNPIGALIDFVIGFAQDVFGGIGIAIVNFIVRLLEAIGLGFLGNFLRILYEGFCNVLQVVINVVLVAIRILTLGYVNKSVSLCCSGDCRPTQSRRRDDDANSLDDLIDMDKASWLKVVARYVQWPVSDVCNETIDAFKEKNWTLMDDYEQGETLYCFVKLMWFQRDDEQDLIMNSTCDAMMSEYNSTRWTKLSVLEKRTIIDCMHSRLYMEVLRTVTNLRWIPQDLMTNDKRKYQFAAGLIKGYILNWQFFSDKTKPTEVILTRTYREYWAGLGLDTSIYDNLTTVEDVAAFKKRIHLRNYFIANNATQYNATLFTVTGVWSVVDMIAQGIKNVSLAFSDNQTDPRVYISHNYTLDNSIEASASSLLGILGRFAQMVTEFTSYWKEPENYRKRAEAYDQFREVGLILYRKSIDELRLMSLEYFDTKVYEAQFFNNTCSSEEECRAAGVTQFADEYRKSFTGQDARRGETSMVYKLSRWWRNFSFTTTYPLQNTRYPPRDFYAEYAAANNITTNWTRVSPLERFYEYVAIVREGTPASNRRWQILSGVFELVKDRVYTRVLKSYYNNQTLYETTSHHAEMQAKYRQQREKQAREPEEKHRLQQKMGGHLVCDPLRATNNVTLCQRWLYFGSETDYDVDVPEYGRELDGVQIQRLAATHSSQAKTAPLLRDKAVSEMLVRASNFLSIDCGSTVVINFPCTPPLNCTRPDGTQITTTSLCDQCRYLHLFIDVVLSATAEIIEQYRAGGAFDRSVENAYAFYEYSTNSNIAAIVGDSPLLSVAGFPAPGATFYESFANSMRYFGDNTPNKLRFRDFEDLANRLISSSSSTSSGGKGFWDMEINDTATAKIMGVRSGDWTVINNIVYDVVYWIARPVVEFFARLYRLLITSESEANNRNGDSFSAAAGYTLETFLFCRPGDLTGKNKRNSIGELVVASVVLLGFSGTILVSVVGFNVMSLLAMLGIGGIVFLNLFLTLHDNRGAFCLGLSTELANDLFYAVAFNFVPKCSWFWGFLLPGYTNSNCQSCDTLRNLRPYHCVRDLGFRDITYNLVFFLEFYVPSVFAYIRTPNTPLNFLYRFEAISQRMDAFANIEFDDPFVASHYLGCNWIITLPLNLFLALLLLIGVSLFAYAVIVVLIDLVSWLLRLLSQQGISLYFISRDLVLDADDMDDYSDDIDDEEAAYNDEFEDADYLVDEEESIQPLRTSVAYPSTFGFSPSAQRVARFYRDNWYGKQKTR